MYYPYYGKKAQVGLTLIQTLWKHLYQQDKQLQILLVAILRFQRGIICMLPSVLAGELLSASGRRQVPEHHHQSRRQRRVQDQQRSHWKRKRQVRREGVFQAEDQHQQIGRALKTPFFILCNRAHTQKKNHSIHTLCWICLQPPSRMFRGVGIVFPVVRREEAKK